mmetsp:Transcript_48670/g.77547  ORF Transcript_48670/g.77547 Transcript_48670/m.77547 type:complete len:227 (+) Transcript_48670:3-683(+)
MSLVYVGQHMLQTLVETQSDGQGWQLSLLWLKYRFTDGHDVYMHFPPTSTKGGVQDSHWLRDGPEQVRQVGWQTLPRASATSYTRGTSSSNCEETRTSKRVQPYGATSAGGEVRPGTKDFHGISALSRHSTEASGSLGLAASLTPCASSRIDAKYIETRGMNHAITAGVPILSQRFKPVKVPLGGYSRAGSGDNPCPKKLILERTKCSEYSRPSMSSLSSSGSINT